MPYLMLQDQLRNFFKSQSATLIAVGYSFSDEHINDLIAQGLRSNPNAKVLDSYTRVLRNTTVHDGLHSHSEA